MPDLDDYETVSFNEMEYYKKPDIDAVLDRKPVLSGQALIAEGKLKGKSYLYARLIDDEWVVTKKGVSPKLDKLFIEEDQAKELCEKLKNQPKIGKTRGRPRGSTNKKTFKKGPIPQNVMKKMEAKSREFDRLMAEDATPTDSDISDDDCKEPYICDSDTSPIARSRRAAPPPSLYPYGAQRGWEAGAPPAPYYPPPAYPPSSYPPQQPVPSNDLASQMSMIMRDLRKDAVKATEESKRAWKEVRHAHDETRRVKETLEKKITALKKEIEKLRRQAATPVLVKKTKSYQEIEDEEPVVRKRNKKHRRRQDEDEDDE